MALLTVRDVGRVLVGVLPKRGEENHHDNRQNSYADCLGLLEDLDEAVHERGQPEKPFQKGGKHDCADDSGIDDLWYAVSARSGRSIARMLETHVFGRPMAVDGRNSSVPGVNAQVNHCLCPHHGEELKECIRVVK
jgi:hypothetical protein